MAYITADNVANYKNDQLSANGQAVLAQIIPGICALVDRYCNRTWTIDDSTEITQVFDGGTKTFFVSNPTINSIVSITIDGNPQDASFYYNYGTYIELSDVAAAGDENVTIVYTTSANSVPADLKLALIQWAARMLDESDDDGKQTTRTMSGPVQTYYKEEGDIPDFVLRVLDSYRLTPAF